MARHKRRRTADRSVNRSIQIRIGRSHDRRRCPAIRHSGNVHALRVDEKITHYLLGNSGDQRSLPATTPLVFRSEPVPTSRRISSRWLFGVRHQTGQLFRMRVHPRAGREILRVLLAAVQHDDQRHRLAAVAARYIQPVVTHTSVIVV